jgi:hypothetical protein
MSRDFSRRKFISLAGMATPLMAFLPKKNEPLFSGPLMISTWEEGKDVNKIHKIIKARTILFQNEIDGICDKDINKTSKRHQKGINKT